MKPDLSYDGEKYISSNEDLEEADLEVYEQQGFTNIDVRKNKKTGNSGLEPNTYIDVEKNFVDGINIFEDEDEGYSLWACKVTYKDQDVSMVLSGDEHDRYKETGGEGDKVRVRRVMLDKEDIDSPFYRREFVKLDD